MILAQIIKVIPAASSFKVFDNNKPVLEGMTSIFDKSLIFENVDDDIKFQKVYAAFHVELVDKENDIWIINVR